MRNIHAVSKKDGHKRIAAQNKTTAMIAKNGNINIISCLKKN